MFGKLITFPKYKKVLDLVSSACCKHCEHCTNGNKHNTNWVAKAPKGDWRGSLGSLSSCYILVVSRRQKVTYHLSNVWPQSLEVHEIMWLSYSAWTCDKNIDFKSINQKHSHHYSFQPSLVQWWRNASLPPFLSCSWKCSNFFFYILPVLRIIWPVSVHFLFLSSE